MASSLPQGGIRFAWTGMETDLILNRGAELRGFASYPLRATPLRATEDGRTILRGAFGDVTEVARDHGLGAILEGPAWMANRDRGAAIGTDPDTLRRRNVEAIALMGEVRDRHPDVAEVLDDGDPEEFGAQLAALRRAHPQLTVLGGCCGTEMRHLRAVADRVARV